MPDIPIFHYVIYGEEKGYAPGEGHTPFRIRLREITGKL
jgi:hypothetical protein